VNTAAPLRKPGEMYSAVSATRSHEIGQESGPEDKNSDEVRETESDRQNSTNSAELWHLFSSGWKLASQRRGLVARYCVATLVASLSTVAMAQAFAEVLRRLSAQGVFHEKGTLLTLWVLWALSALVSSGMALLRRIAATKIDLFFSTTIRKQLFDRVLHEAPDFFYTHDPGKIATVVNGFTVEAAVTTRQVSVDLPLQVIAAAISTGMIIYNLRMPGGSSNPGWRLAALVVVLAALVSLYLTERFSKRVQRASQELQDRMLALATLVTGVAQSPEEIQTFAAEPLFQLKHAGSLDRFSDAYLGNVRTTAFLTFLSDLPSWGVQLLLLSLAIVLALWSQTSASVGNVVAILQLTPGLMGSIVLLCGYVIMAKTAAPKVRQIEAILVPDATSEKYSKASEPDHVEPWLEVRDLTFSYGLKSRPIFSDVSFVLPPGKITGFVARMGQGKTTFFKLALRFYEPEKGDIFLGGHSLRSFALSSLRRHIGMMSQFPAFFYDSLRDNLRMAELNATDDDIRRLCERTGIWQILAANLVGSNPLDADFAAGRNFSGGQKKLLALTRCLLRNPAVLLLDEPTVGMSNDEKFEILVMLREAVRGRTVMVVDHDVNWLINFCDHFIVLEEGRIVAQGTAQELLSKDTQLRRLYTVTQGPKSQEIASWLTHWTAHPSDSQSVDTRKLCGGARSVAQNQNR
jgi:ATP-binding cassette, subfamily B, bacterial